MGTFIPRYIESYRNGILKQKVKTSGNLLSDCTLCPKKCRVNRLEGKTGICKTGKNAVVASFDAHFGEEAPLVGTHGSGTIFFSYCNLLCNFCQNYEISHLGEGREVSSEILGKMMFSLQQSGCHNVNLVTPSHVVPQILSALEIAIEMGLSIPLVYNSSAYDALETLKILDGIIDIYMPDVKFFDPSVAKKTCNSYDYPLISMASIKEMHRQVGNLVVDDSNIALKGLLVRHLVLPKNFAGTKEIMTFISEEISKETYVNIMPQYRPCGMAHTIKELSSHITKEEFADALETAKLAGIERLDIAQRKFKLFF